MFDANRIFDFPGIDHPDAECEFYNFSDDDERLIQIKSHSVHLFFSYVGYYWFVPVLLLQCIFLYCYSTPCCPRLP
jgi:hypothetical protein